MAGFALPLGANDDIISTASLVSGVASAHSQHGNIPALTSAASFASGAALPLAVTAFAPAKNLIAFTVATTLVALAFLGGLAAKTGGAKILSEDVRVTFWSALAIGISSGVGMFFGGGPKIHNIVWAWPFNTTRARARGQETGSSAKRGGRRHPLHPQISGAGVSPCHVCFGNAKIDAGGVIWKKMQRAKCSL